MTETEKQAREIYEEYDVPFPKPWAGLKFIWHPWHQPASRLYWPMLFEEFCKRAVEIGTKKPERERLERLTLMRPAKRQLAIPKYFAKAWEAYVKTREAYAKAWEAYAKAREPYAKTREAYAKAWEPYAKAREAYDKAREAYAKAWEPYAKTREAYAKAWEANVKAREAYDKAREAYDKAWEAYVKAHKKQILAIHAVECPNCRWDGEKLPQFD